MVSYPKYSAYNLSLLCNLANPPSPKWFLVPDGKNGKFNLRRLNALKSALTNLI